MLSLVFETWVWPWIIKRSRPACVVLAGLLLFSLAAPSSGQEVDENDGDFWVRTLDSLEYAKFGHSRELAKLLVDEEGPYYEVQFDEEDPAHAAAVACFGKVLKGFYSRKKIWVVRKGSSKVGNAFDVTYLTPLPWSAEPYAAWDYSWGARIFYRASFEILARTQLAVAIDDGYGNITDGVGTSKISATAHIDINFDAESKTMTLVIHDVDRNEPGPLLGLESSYAVRATKRITTSAKSQNFSAGYKDGGFDLSLGVERSKSKRRLATTAIGSKAISDFFLFRCSEVAFIDGTRFVDFAFDSNWTTTTDLRWSQKVVYDVVGCESKKGLDVSFKFEDSQNGKVANEQTTKCTGSSKVADASIRWYAKSLVDGDVGMYSSSRILCSYDGDCGGSAYYQPALGNYLDWVLQVSSPLGGIDLKQPRKTKHGLQTRKRYYFRKI